MVALEGRPRREIGERHARLLDAGARGGRQVAQRVRERVGGGLEAARRRLRALRVDAGLAPEIARQREQPLRRRVHAEELGRDVLDLVGLVEDHGVVRAAAPAPRASAHVSARSAKNRWWLTTISGAAAARRRIAVTKQLSKNAQRGPMRVSGVAATSPHSGASSASSRSSARSPVGDDAANARMPIQLGLGDQRSLPVALAEAPPADVVREALHDGPLERRRQQAGVIEHRAQARQVDAGDLVLQRLGAGADDDLASRQQRRHQVGERLAGAGAGLDQQALVAVDRVGDAVRHRQLSGTRLVAGKQRRRRARRSQQRTDALPHRLAAVGAGTGHRRGHFLRLAFSSMPEMPNRRAQLGEHGVDRHAGRLQADQHVEDQIGRLVRGVRRVASRAAPRSARRDSSAILPLIFGIPASSSDTTYDFSGRSRRRVAITSATRATTSAGGSGGASSSIERAVVADAAVETGRRAGVARRARRIAQVEDDVAVAVDAHVADRQRVPRRLALLPGRLARSAPEVRGAGRQRRRERVAVRPREHAHHARAAPPARSPAPGRRRRT